LTIHISRDAGGHRGADVRPDTQTVMAILVFGGAALIIGTGLIGAIRRH
jgi:hypothetical protein